MGLVIGLESGQIELQGDEIVIGRSPAVQVSLPGDVRVADRHAVLRLVGARWLIEAQGEAAIRVGNGRPTKVAWLNPGDVIHLTETGPTITFSPNGKPPSASAEILSSDLIVEMLSDSEPIRMAKPMPTKPSPDKTESDIFNIPPELKKDFDPDDAAPPKVPTLTRQAMPASSAAPPTPPVTAPFQEAVQDVFQDVFTSAMIKTLMIGGLAAVLFAVLWTLLRPRYEVPTSVSPPPNPAVPGPVNVARVDPPRPAVKLEPVKPEPVKPVPSSSEKLAAAVYLVLMSDEDRDQTFRLGTAWAVEKRRLVTTGSVALELLEKREIFPNIAAKAGGKTVAITEILIHPEFRRAASAVAAVKKELEDLQTEVEESGESEPSEEMKPQLAAAQSNLLDALEERMHYDLAILEVDRDLKDVLPVSADLAAVWPGTSIKLIGFPFPKDERLTDPAGPRKPVSISGLAQVKAADGDHVKHWLTKFRDIRPKDDWRGSPVLNAGGQVIGIYCQPSPPGESRDDVPSTHEVTPITRLAEIQP